MKASSEIHILPNTGHHTYFVPLPSELIKKLDAGTTPMPTGDMAAPPSVISTPILEGAELKRRMLGNQIPWLVHSKHSWVRYRLGSSMDDVPAILGVWISLESNVGPTERGIQYHSPEKLDVTTAPKTSESKSIFAYPSPGNVEYDVRLRITVPIGREEMPLPAVVWVRPSVANAGSQGSARPVDLIVDFGNTRSVAMVIEHDHDKHRRLSDVCGLVRFVRRGSGFERFKDGQQSEDPCAIVDSWIILHEPIFANLEPPKSEECLARKITVEQKRVGILRKTAWEVNEVCYVPQAFVELSPAIMGGGNGPEGARSILRNRNVINKPNCFQSSPKRYAWDDRPRLIGGQQYWHVELNSWDRELISDTSGSLPELQGPILMYMDEHGTYWSIDDDDVPFERNAEARPHPRGAAVFPRRDTLTWAALTIIETAYRQICSAEFRRARDENVPRQLRNIVVTVPSGWTSEEKNTYRRQWQMAIDIFTLSRFENRNLYRDGGQRPHLVMELDEAIASQLPLIYSEMQRNRCGEKWIELVGRPVKDNVPAVRVMNLDIGGGTTDVAVVDYCDTGSSGIVNLKSTLLFKNSSGIAGDSLVKRIIERVLLPQIGSVLVGNKEHQMRFEKLFKEPPQAWRDSDDALSERLVRIVRLVFVPIVEHWLQALNQVDAKIQHGKIPPEEMKAADGSLRVDTDILKDLNKLVRQHVKYDGQILDPAEGLPVAWDVLKRCIFDEFEDFFNSLTTLTAAFDCDLLLVSGKPSELKVIQQLIQKTFPLPASRVMFAHGFLAGDWYPIDAEDGIIRDAKTVTVVGAALHQAMKNNQIRDWVLVPNAERQSMERNYWGRMPDSAFPGDFEKHVYLTPEQDEATVMLKPGTAIGRKRFRSPGVMPDQVYVLEMKNVLKTMGQIAPLLSVKLTRDSEQGLTECLRLVEVSSDDPSHPVSMDDVQLRVCTLEDGAFWMDRPRFNIKWFPSGA